jgi:hypothetical protein
MWMPLKWTEKCGGKLIEITRKCVCEGGKLSKLTSKKDHCSLNLVIYCIFPASMLKFPLFLNSKKERENSGGSYAPV